MQLVIGKKCRLAQNSPPHSHMEIFIPSGKKHAPLKSRGVFMIEKYFSSAFHAPGPGRGAVFFGWRRARFGPRRFKIPAYGRKSEYFFQKIGKTADFETMLRLGFNYTCKISVKYARKV